MSKKAIVVQGAICKCQFGNTPDKIKVLSHQKEFANDSEGAKKLIVTTLEVGGVTLEKNCFGSCNLQRNRPCKAVISEWQDYYEDVTLSNGGYIILENSKAICPMAGSPCIEITHHGQLAQPSEQNFKNADEDVQGQLNPMVDMNEVLQAEPTHNGLITN